MKNIAIIGACALTQYMTLALSKKYPQAYLYVWPGNGATDLYPRTYNLSLDFDLSAKSVELLKTYDISHVLVLDQHLLLKGALEYLQSYGFITQISCTKTQYLTQKITQSRLWATRSGLDSWPCESCHDTSKAHIHLSRLKNSKVCTESGLFSTLIPLKDLKNLQLRSLPFQTLVIEQELERESLVTQVFDAEKKICLKEYLHLEGNKFVSQKPEHDLTELTVRLLDSYQQEGFLTGRYFVLSWTCQEHPLLNQKYKFCQISSLFHSTFFPALENIDWKKSDLFEEQIFWNKKKNFSMKPLFDFFQKNSNYQVMENWEKKTHSIFHNFSARYENGQILARKPHYGYDLG